MHINLDTWQDDLQQAEQMSLDKFIETVIDKNMRNSVFVDVTANADVARFISKLIGEKHFCSCM